MMDPARAAALSALLGRAHDPAAALIPFGHHVYFWTPEPPDRLGRDGHPRPGIGAIPDTGLPRRMWAGGRLAFHAPLWPGRPAVRRTVCEGIERKDGRSGPLAFVALRHEVTQDGQAVLTEWQELVYRADPTPTQPAAAPPQATGEPEVRRNVTFDAVTLFRYSALTLNGHRIHYDAAYSTQTEGYRGVVVHGPLLAQHLMLLAVERMGRLARFAFRATAPLILGETASLCAADNRFWVEGPEGRLCMTADAG
ncbi:MAG: acyl dehydratase [Paracoccaceae bacterium]|nr:MAG: acyl dehydratase [Paracoccaceae bacterium]